MKGLASRPAAVLVLVAWFQSAWLLVRCYIPCNYLHQKPMSSRCRGKKETRAGNSATVGSCKRFAKTYNSGYSLVVTHLTTNPPVRCLNRAERTGSLVFNVLWSYVQVMSISLTYNLHQNGAKLHNNHQAVSQYLPIDRSISSMVSSLKYPY
jgi:hypothetical protein